MKYATFSNLLTEKDITGMFYNDELEAVCYKCKNVNVVSAEKEEFKCETCGESQGSPQYNPEEYEKERPIC